MIKDADKQKFEECQRKNAARSVNSKVSSINLDGGANKQKRIFFICELFTYSDDRIYPVCKCFLYKGNIRKNIAGKFCPVEDLKVD